MGTNKYTEFGLCIKKRLLDINMSQEELISEVSQKTGLFVDSGYISKILTGKRNAPKVKEAICSILEINLESVETQKAINS